MNIKDLETVYVAAPFTMNGVTYKGFKVINSAQKHLMKQTDPTAQELPEIFKKIAASIHAKKVEPDAYDYKNNPIFSLSTCSAGVLGYAKDHQSTKLTPDENGFMRVFHHPQRSGSW